MELHSDGALNADEMAALDRHLGTCADCREWRQEIPAMVGLIREAHTDLEPQPTFRQRVAASLGRRPALDPDSLVRHLIALRIGWYMAGAAAILLFCLYVFRPEGGRVLTGTISDGSDVVRQGARYRTEDRTAITVGESARALMPAGTSFSVRDEAIHIHEGDCYVVALCAGRMPPAHPRVVVADREAHLVGEAHVYLHVPRVIEARRNVLQVLSDVLVPSAWAGGDAQDAFMLVFAGTARVHTGGHVVPVSAGEMLFLNRPGEEPIPIESFTEDAAASVGSGSGTAELDRQIALYRNMIRGYDSDLASKRERIAATTDVAPNELAELETRVSRIDDVRAAHAARLRELSARRDVMLSSTERTQLEELLRRVRRAEDEYEPTVRALLAM